MSTGATGNGLADADAYTTRTNTYSSGDQVASADLNAIQDGVIDVSEAVDDALGNVAPSRTCTGNQSDSPAPSIYGGGSVWIEKVTNGTTEVVIDTTLDWRDRVLLIKGLFLSHTPFSTSLPGGADDDSVDYDLTSSTPLDRFVYTQEGHDGTASEPGVAHVHDTDEIRVYARDTDGALCMIKSADADTYQTILWAEFRHSPEQGHY